MKLLTKELCKKIPDIGKGSKIAYVKFFTPWGSWSWFVKEARAEVENGEEILEMSLKEATVQNKKIKDVLFYGLVEGFEREFGYFRLAELEELRGPWGLKVERDLYWEPLEVT